MKSLTRVLASKAARILLLLFVPLLASCSTLFGKDSPVPNSIGDLPGNCHMLVLVGSPAPGTLDSPFYFHIKGYTDHENEPGYQTLVQTGYRMIRAKPGTYNLNIYVVKPGASELYGGETTTVECPAGRIFFVTAGVRKVSEAAFLSPAKYAFSYRKYLVAEGLNQSLIDVVKNNRRIDIVKFEKFIFSDGATSTDYLLADPPPTTKAGSNN